jgi:hypothetical protein
MAPIVTLKLENVFVPMDGLVLNAKKEFVRWNCMERIVKMFVNAIRITVFLVIPGLVFKI